MVAWLEKSDLATVYQWVGVLETMPNNISATAPVALSPTQMEDVEVFHINYIDIVAFLDVSGDEYIVDTAGVIYTPSQTEYQYTRLAEDTYETYMNGG